MVDRGRPPDVVTDLLATLEKLGGGTCEDVSERHRQIFGTEARVELTIEIDPAACNSAKAKTNRAAAAKRVKAVC